MGIVRDLYELSEDFLRILEEMEDDNWDDQVLRDTLEGLMGDIEYKAESMAKIIRMNQMSAASCKEEADRIIARAKSYERKADFFKDVLFQNLKATGIPKVKTNLFTISIAKNGGKEPLKITGSVDDIPGKYLIPQPPVPNNDAIRALLAEKEVDWAHLEPRGEHLGIR